MIQLPLPVWNNIKQSCHDYLIHHKQPFAYNILLSALYHATAYETIEFTNMLQSSWVYPKVETSKQGKPV